MALEGVATHATDAWDTRQRALWLGLSQDVLTTRCCLRALRVHAPRRRRRELLWG